MIECLRPVSFKEPMSSAGLAIEVHRAASTLQGRLQLIRLCKVTKVGYSRVAVVARPCPVGDDDGTDLLAFGDREIRREIATQREANHRQAAVGLAGTFAEEHCCHCDVGLGLDTQ